MKLHLSELVITPENEATARRIQAITQQHEQPELLYVSGPANSGKSAFFQARGLEKDLLSTKHTMYCHAAEILTMLGIDNENADTFLNRVGEVDVLLIDDVDHFLQNEDMGVQACTLLIESRTRQGLDTAVAARPALAQLDSKLQAALAGFSELALQPLDEQGMCTLARTLEQQFCQEKEDTPTNELSNEAIEYLAKRFVTNPQDMTPAIEFLVTVVELPEHKPISAALAEELLQV